LKYLKSMISSSKVDLSASMRDYARQHFEREPNELR
jgi:hypothetical protein